VDSKKSVFFRPHQYFIKAISNYMQITEIVFQAQNLTINIRQKETFTLNTFTFLSGFFKYFKFL